MSRQVEINALENHENDFNVSARGVWHRPNVLGTETNLDGIISTIDTFSKIGINMVFLETFYHGMTTYKSNYVPYYSTLKNNDYGQYPDYLSAFLGETKKRNIEVHAWVEDFYIGINENYFTKNLPDWILLTKSGSIRQNEGNGYIFLDPANPEVQSYLITFYDEMLSKFPDLSGLNLDYIRYPVSASDDSGYTKVAMNNFSQINNLDFSNGTVNEFDNLLSKNKLLSKWTEFKADNVTSFVSKVFDLVKTKHNTILLSSAVFPNATSAYQTKKQDFVTWMKNGYLDICTPMAYYDDNNTLKKELQAMVSTSDDCYCYAGLSTTYHKLSNSMVESQMNIASNISDGYVFFGSQSILGNENYINYLSNLKTTNNYSEVLPHSTKSALILEAIKYISDETLIKKLSADNISSVDIGLLVNEYSEYKDILFKLSKLVQIYERRQEIKKVEDNHDDNDNPPLDEIDDEQNDKIEDCNNIKIKNVLPIILIVFLRVFTLAFKRRY